MAAVAGPYSVVGIALLWGAWVWRPELTPAPYLNDSSIQEQMVRFAAKTFEAGHLPLTSWFPYLGLGSPQFLHYQSLPAMLTGLLGMGIGADSAFRWTLYLLLVTWPLSLYWSARVAGFGGWVAAAAGLVAPFLVSATGVGYEAGAYVWIGYGLWAQLWASWTLPLAWAFTWRAMSSRRAIFPAVVFVSLTVALHFETGYLALIPIGLLPFVCPSELRSRLGRAAVVGVASLLATAWVTVPLIVDGRWAATNEPFAHSALVNGYGARRVLGWLITGRLYDAGRIPLISVFVAIGLLASLVHWRSDVKGRLVVTLWAMSLVLSFGRTTFGVLTDVLPGSADIFMRRFMMGTQLAGLYMAGIGAVSLVQGLAVILARWRRPAMSQLRTKSVRVVLVALGGPVALVLLSPAWRQLDSYAAANAAAINYQSGAGSIEQPQIHSLIAYVKSHGGGRVYAGMPSNWGIRLRVGAVPVFKYLESADVDEVGYTLRTASLMTDPEYFFDEKNPGDYALFGIRYLVLPAGWPAPVPARPVLAAGIYRLWILPNSGYVRVVDTTGVLVANATNVGERSVSFLRSSLPAEGCYLGVAFAGGSPAPLSAQTPGCPRSSPGQVLSANAQLSIGEASAVVLARRSAVVALSVSFDPGWTVRVDGHTTRTEMLAPAVVGVVVPAGVHRVVFVYVGFSYYPELLALAALVFVGLAYGFSLHGNEKELG